MDVTEWPIRLKQDFPKEGVLFRDLMPWFMDRAKFEVGIEMLMAVLPPCRCIAAVEARGWIIGSVLADRLGVELIPVRRSGKLPFVEMETLGHSEYAEFSYQLPTLNGQVRGDLIVIDDVLATGKTAEAVGGMLRRCGFQLVGYGFFVTLEEFKGWEKLGPVPTFSVVTI